MTYLIDGHNLIPKLPGMSLDQLDDEQELINQLAAFSARTSRQVEVFFDQGQVNSQRDYQRNRVHVHFVRKPMIADTAIISRLLGIGKAARNYTVVSGDHEVQNRARRLGAAILSSAEFAKRLLANSGSGEKGGSDSPPEKGKDDIQEWLDLFSKGKKID
jgi:uncharacterized protein